MADGLPRSPAAVRAAFDAIATDFDRTRSAPWPAVERFVSSTAGGDRALDVGCGNGRHVPGLLGRYRLVVGLDLTRRLLEVAHRAVGSARFGLVEGTANDLPFGTDAFDAALYVATIHHLPDRPTRVASLDELARVLRPGARVLVSGWSVAHERFEHPSATDTTVDWTLPSGETVPRYYHLYDEADFSAEVAASRLGLDRLWTEAGNCYAVCAAPRE